MLLHGTFVVHVTFPNSMSYSDFWSLVLGVLMWTAQHMYVPIDIGGCASCSILTTRLWFEAWGFQIVGASSFYIHAEPQIFLDVYPTIMRVLHVVPISIHQTTTILVLRSQICSRIHPLLSVHHMLATIVLMLSCNIMIYSSCCNSALSLRATESSSTLLLHLNPKCMTFCAPMRLSHLQSDSPNIGLVQLSCKYNLVHRHFHHRALA